MEAKELIDQGTKHFDAGELDKAIGRFKEAAEKFPDTVAAWVNLAVAQQEACSKSGGAFEGREALERAYSLRRLPTVLNDLANFTKHYDRDYERAVAMYRVAVVRDCMGKTHPGAAYHLAYALLLLANDTNDPSHWREAWMWNEWRKEKQGFGDIEWRGESVEAKTVLVQMEQGFGDRIWCLRHCKELHERGAEVHVLCSPVELPLVERQPYVAKAHDWTKPHDVAVDYGVMAMSMPSYCLPHGGTPVSLGKYVETGITYHGKNKKRKRIGICWQGSTENHYAGWRNLPLDLVEQIVGSRQDVEWVSLQHGKTTKLRIDHKSINSSNDLLDSARLIQSLDLVVTADTVIPHISGALGVPTLVLDRHSGNWYGHEPASRWYDSVEHVQQHIKGNWDRCIARAVDRVLEA